MPPHAHAPRHCHRCPAAGSSTSRGKGRFGEDEARFFQQLISGLEYCHAHGVAHRDLKLENTLIDGSATPRLKICDFGYSKHSLIDSEPKSTVGTPAYIAPEVLSRKAYDGKAADVWSCGVTLYVMVIGAYPFEDPSDARNFRKTIQRILAVQYRFPSHVELSDECKDLIQRIFVDTSRRLNIAGIKAHPGSSATSAELQQAVENDGPSGVEGPRRAMRVVDEQRAARGRGFGGGRWGRFGLLSGRDDEMMDGSKQFSGDYAQYDRPTGEAREDLTGR